MNISWMFCGRDKCMTVVIRNMHTDVITRVEDGRGGTTPEIPIQVGVKQGDPMFPLLFNLALDPLIQTLNELGKGYHLSGRMLVTLVFADDLALVSDSWDGMAYNLCILDAFCELTGLRVQPRKCYGFLLRPIGRDSVTLNDFMTLESWWISTEHDQTLLIYHADHGELGLLALRALDGTTRKAVKEWLHLPMCMTDGLQFAGLKDGELGLQKLE
ncbi:hypothetical protein AOLI_G00291340 [Acnodon oligacanthus]